jgi:hypothetical protein
MNAISFFKKILKPLAVAYLISSEFESARPFMVESNDETKSLKDDSVVPSSTSGWAMLSSTDKIACVAHALLIT